MNGGKGDKVCQGGITHISFKIPSRRIRRWVEGMKSHRGFDVKCEKMKALGQRYDAWSTVDSCQRLVNPRAPVGDRVELPVSQHFQITMTDWI